MTDHVVVGPPGCGKTYWIARQCERALERYGPNGTMVLSLTKAAAREAAGRTGLAREMVGTLHATCYKALGQPKVVDGKAIKVWNTEQPNWALSGAETDDEYGDPPSAETPGDRLLAMLEVYRHKQRDIPAMLEPFADTWQDFKEQSNLIDFTDMIELAYESLPKPPYNPRFFMVDEFQDFSNLELALVRKWAQHVEHFAIVGDPNQSIYHWRHASREAADVEPTLVLGQSYRVPRAVQAAAVQFIKNSSTYLNAEYKPRDEDGAFFTSDALWSEGERLLSYMDRLEGSVMFLASCAYMINPLLGVLRRNGIPYHNPFRAGSAWNPLSRGNDKRHTAADRVEAWLSCASSLLPPGAMPGVDYPTASQITLLSKTMLRKAARTVTQDEIDWMADGGETGAAVRSIFTSDTCAAMAAGDLTWLLNNSQAAARRSMEYPVSVYRRSGVVGMRTTPKIILGTIHSVKGGEADNVVLAPDLSSRGMANFRQPGWENHDGVLRTFYVGMTRAKKTLTVLRPQGWAVDIKP